MLFACLSNMKKIDLNFDCGVDFEKMTPTKKGAVCKECSTEVIDFTKMTLAEIQTYFLNERVICGRFDRATIGDIYDSRENINFKRKIRTLLFIFSFGLYYSGFSQSDSLPEAPAVEKVEIEKIEVESPTKPFKKRRGKYELTRRFPFLHKKRMIVTGCPSF